MTKKTNSQERRDKQTWPNLFSDFGEVEPMRSERQVDDRLPRFDDLTEAGIARDQREDSK